MMKIKYSILMYSSLDLGDDAQPYAIQKIYDYMGINTTDVVYFSKNNILDVVEEGCHYILPLVGADIEYFDFINRVMELQFQQRFSFIPIAIGHTRLEFGNEAILKQFQAIINQMHMPIGCRDSDAAEMYGNLGYPTYLNSCITNTLPKRDENTMYSRNKVYLINVPKSLYSKMPDSIRQESVELTQDISECSAEEEYRMCVDRLEQLRDTARLVVTSRYHIASPCNAMGVPVIMVENRSKLWNAAIDERFSDINPLIPFYVEEQFDEIDWKPHPIDFEDDKACMRNLAISRIETAVSIVNNNQRLVDFFAPSKERFWDDFQLNRFKVDGTGVGLYLDPFLKKFEPSFQYYLYGLSNRYIECGCCILLDHLQKHYPNAVFLGFVDANKTGNAFGKRILRPEEMVIKDNRCCVSAALTANTHIHKLFIEERYPLTHLWEMPEELGFYIYAQMAHPFLRNHIFAL